MGSGPIEIVTLQMGDEIPPYYVQRLLNMLNRHADRPFRLHVMTDRPSLMPKGVEIIDISGWGTPRPEMRPTQHRLRFFQDGGWPFGEFYNFDLTLVVKSSLLPLWKFAESSPMSFVAVKDWKYDMANPCVSRIRKSAELDPIYRDYSSGVRYEVHQVGDMDYLGASTKAHGLYPNKIEFFPPEMIVSYKALRKVHRSDPAKAAELLEKACILKFHGRPRPHELATLKYRLRQAWREPKHLIPDWAYLSKETAAWWV